LAEENNGSLTGRETVALWVIILSGAGISLVAIVAIWVGTQATGDNRNLVMTVFNALIPMFGTWVGTVIAFYFSRENFATAAKATRELVSQLGDDALKQISVKDAWIPVTAIEAVTVDDAKEDTVLVSDIHAKLSSKVSRVPVWNQNKVGRYVIHESMIYKFMAEQNNKAATLRDFLGFATSGTTMKNIVSKIGWVSPNATLGDAKEKMQSIPDCQDVFVTASGAMTEPVLGWITNADIARKAKA
jgi:hypothetical protein